MPFAELNLILAKARLDGYISESTQFIKHSVAKGLEARQFLYQTLKTNGYTYLPVFGNSLSAVAIVANG